MDNFKLVYKDKFEKTKYGLVELGSHELVEAFESGSNIVLKGLPEDDAVLCTDTKTYLVRQVNTSNSMLLVTRSYLNEQYVVHDDLSSTIELLPCLARTNRIDDLLTESSYSGSKNETDIRKTKTLYTYQDLLSIVQASEHELRAALKERGAFEHEGYYRLFDKGFLFRLFDSLVTSAVLLGIDFNNMTLEQAKQCILEEMSAVDEEEVIPDNVLLASIKSLIANDVDQNDAILQFDEHKICRFLGEWLLTNPRVKKPLLMSM
ncbi:sister chromatid cohesion protein Dcc1 [Gilbertella persicaria]|uniref:sister chromatid cohesion protein Dcc1 n=1 Tax=Gilbertella persicaria TaxID=101096 RepID=UPI00221FF222|nr:sister chromatid cohesion protein Dcc1 [Gilbertella persicaria]KAI8080801.1 sister chromatid cohesion protein Dcc1 [Gilbertella persicaria]